jgi:hypothetical protein
MTMVKMWSNLGTGPAAAAGAASRGRVTAVRQRMPARSRVRRIQVGRVSGTVVASWVGYGRNLGGLPEGDATRR